MLLMVSCLHQQHLQLSIENSHIPLLNIEALRGKLPANPETEGPFDQSLRAARRFGEIERWAKIVLIADARLAREESRAGATAIF
jgi:hypothetical protein